MLMFRECYHCGDQLLNYGIFMQAKKVIVCSESCAENAIKYQGHSEAYRLGTFEECRDYGRE